jgi:hypothetical protein
MKPFPVRRGLAATLAIALLVAPLPAVAQEAPKPAAPSAAVEGAPGGLASIEAWLRDEQGEHLVGASFLLVSLDGRVPPVSAVTDRLGRVTLRQLSYGYYRYSVEAAGGVYLGNRILLVPPDRGVDIEVDLTPFLPEDEKLGLSRTDPVPGTDKVPVGVARLLERTGPTGLAWFQTGKGVAVIVGAGVLLVGAMIALTDSGSQTTAVSPSSPSR